MNIRPAPLAGIMGHVKETEHVHEVEAKYRRVLVGCSARWRVVGGMYRTDVHDDGKWCGVFPLNKDDLEKYEVTK